MDPNNTFALIIGIDTYLSEEYISLKAAVNDANTMSSYLHSTLRVPLENIINLRNEQASRRGILEGFHVLHELSAGEKIGLTLEEKRNPPCIVIFYAGHGARTEKPAQWGDWAVDSAHVEMLCPCDIGVPLEGEAEQEGAVVEGIPDRTVCYLLNRLSKERGNNITLILDCCCSAGLNRGSRDDEVTRGYPRSIANPPPLSGKADPQVVYTPEDSTDTKSAVGTTRGVRQAAGFGGKFQDSHVLLAACGRDAQAFENKGRGLFTSVLLSLLPSVDLGTTTYASLMTRMHKMPKWQTPHCEGSSIDRPLFSRTGYRSDPSYIPCKRSKGDDGQLVVSLDAGIAQGITTGELFSIHENNFREASGNPNPSIGILSAGAVKTASSTLQHPPGHKRFKIPRNFYAKRIDWGNDPPKVFCEDAAFLNAVFPSPANMTGRKVIAVKEEEEASLVMKVEGSKVRISRTDPFVTTYIPRELPYTFSTTSPRDIQTIVGAWQHFNYHLYRRGRDEFPKVRMELHYLELSGEVGDMNIDYDSFEPENYRVKGENLLKMEPAEVRVPDWDADRPLGMTLYNDGDLPLYPYLFYFDPNELTIIPWFTSPFGAGSGNVDPPLGPHSQFPIGYGNGAATPWQFCFEDDRDKDLGFFKLFLSVSPMNFHSLIQEESPFKRLGLSQTRSGGATPAEQVTLEFDEDSWGVKVATVIQLR